MLGIYWGLFLMTGRVDGQSQDNGKQAPEQNETSSPKDLETAKSSKQTEKKQDKTQADGKQTDAKKGDTQDNKGAKNGQTQGKEMPAKNKSDDTETKPSSYLFGVQSTSVLQNLFRFHSPYTGPSSLHSRSDAELTQSLTLFAGYKVARNVEIFVNPEWLLGSGLSAGRGLSGPSNAEVSGQGTVSNDPYLARAFVRWRVPLKGAGKTKPFEVGRSENLIPGLIPARRLVISIGKYSVSDVFDASRYANDPQTEFLADPLTNNAAIDLPRNIRGYTLGATVAWVNPEFAIRVGSFEMPTAAGQDRLAGDISVNRGDIVEGEAYPRLFGKHTPPAIIRLQAFHNLAHAGRYSDAPAQTGVGMPPDITKVEHSGAVKYGYGFGLEQPIADDGKTGAFLRYGWNNGATETYAFDETDRTLTLGGQFSGAHWKRPDDRIGLAIVTNDLSAAHKGYLMAGGMGLQLGDGNLSYGSERWIETYYSYQLSKHGTVSLHYQFINNPGYNQDRGPVSIISLRLHLEFGL